MMAVLLVSLPYWTGERPSQESVPQEKKNPVLQDFSVNSPRKRHSSNAVDRVEVNLAYFWRHTIDAFLGYYRILILAFVLSF